MKSLDLYTEDLSESDPSIAGYPDGSSDMLDATPGEYSGLDDDGVDVGKDRLVDASDRVVVEESDLERIDEENLKITDATDQAEDESIESERVDEVAESDETIKYREVLDVFQRWRAENVDLGGPEDDDRRVKYDGFERELSERISKSLEPKDGVEGQTHHDQSEEKLVGNGIDDTYSTDITSGHDVDSEEIEEDGDSEEFRIESIPRVHPVLVSQNEQLSEALESRDPDRLKDLLINGADELNRAALGLGEEESVTSGKEIAVHNLGSPTWRRPERADDLTHDIKTELAARYCDGRMDSDRLAKGTYLTDILVHRNDNGNGRVARGQKIALERAASNNPITDEDTRNVLAIGRETLTQTGEHKYKINFSPDMERFMMGTCHYALYRGVEYDDIVDNLGLNRLLPEDSLRVLADRFGENAEETKEDYIRFMALESDLNWWQD